MCDRDRPGAAGPARLVLLPAVLLFSRRRTAAAAAASLTRYREPHISVGITIRKSSKTSRQCVSRPSPDATLLLLLLLLLSTLWSKFVAKELCECANQGPRAPPFCQAQLLVNNAFSAGRRPSTAVAMLKSNKFRENIPSFLLLSFQCCVPAAA